MELGLLFSSGEYFHTLCKGKLEPALTGYYLTKQIP